MPRDCYESECLLNPYGHELKSNRGKGRRKPKEHGKRKSFHMLLNPIYDNGFFSNFTVVLGMLEQYEQGKYLGLTVDFSDHGLYYEAALGSNWWSYYFDPIDLESDVDTKVVRSSVNDYMHAAGIVLYEMSRIRANELIGKYIIVRPEILSEVNAYVDEYFRADHVIGVHYRGTDKITSREATFVNYSAIYEALVQHLDEAEIQDYIVFIATDEAPFLNFMKERFPSKVICQCAHRSDNNTPIHLESAEPYMIGKEALLDCLILSHCDYLIRTSSNLSICSTFFNPTLPEKLIMGNSN